MDVLASHLQELITDQRHFLARAEKILDYLEKNNIPTDTSFTSKTDPKPDHLNVEELHELERAVREAALYLLNAVNKKSLSLENPKSKAKNSSKPSSRVKSTKKERNLDTDDSTSSQLSSRSSASSNSELPVSNLNINITVVAPQKKAAKKRGKAKNQRKQGTSDSTTLISNIHTEEVPDGNNTDITSASLPRFNQAPRFDNRSDNHDPNSIPPWFWYLCSLILLHNHSNSPTVNIYNYTEKLQQHSIRVKGKGNIISSNKMNGFQNQKSTNVTGTEVNLEVLDLDLG